MSIVYIGNTSKLDIQLLIGILSFWLYWQLYPDTDDDSDVMTLVQWH